MVLPLTLRVIAAIIRFIKDVKWEMKPTKREWILGYDNANTKEKAYTYVIMELNHYIQITNWKDKPLALTEFKGNLRSTEYIERMIAQKKDRLETHDRKWKGIFELIA